MSIVLMAAEPQKYKSLRYAAGRDKGLPGPCLSLAKPASLSTELQARFVYASARITELIALILLAVSTFSPIGNEAHVTNRDGKVPPNG